MYGSPEPITIFHHKNNSKYYWWYS